MASADKRPNSKGEVDEGPIPFFGNSGGETDLFGSLVSSQSTQPAQAYDWNNTSHSNKGSIPPRSNSTAPATQPSVPFSPQYPTPQRPKTTEPSVHQGADNASSFFDNYSATQNVSVNSAQQNQAYMGSSNAAPESSFFDNLGKEQQMYGHQAQVQTPSYDAYQAQSYVDPNSQQYQQTSNEADWYSQNAYQQQHPGYGGAEGAYAQQADPHSQYQGDYQEYQQSNANNYDGYNNYYEGYDQQDPSAAAYYNQGQGYVDPSYNNPNAEYQNQDYAGGYGYDYQGYDYNSSAQDPAYTDYYQQYDYNGQYTEGGGEMYNQPTEQVPTDETSAAISHYPTQPPHPQHAPDQKMSSHQGKDLAETQSSDPSAFFESFSAENNDRIPYEHDYSIPEGTNYSVMEKTSNTLTLQDQTVPDSPAVALVNPSEELEINYHQDPNTQVDQTSHQQVTESRSEFNPSSDANTQEHIVPEDEISIVKDNSDIFETAENHVTEQVAQPDVKEPPTAKPLEQKSANDPLGQTEDIDINDPSLFDTAADMFNSFVGGSYASDKQSSPKSPEDQSISFEQNNSQSDNLDDLDDLVLGSTSSLQDTASMEKNNESEKDSSDYDVVAGTGNSPDVASPPLEITAADVPLEEETLKEADGHEDGSKLETQSSEPSLEQSTSPSIQSVQVPNDELANDEELIGKEEISEVKEQNFVKDDALLELHDLDTNHEDILDSEGKESPEGFVSVVDQQSPESLNPNDTSVDHPEDQDSIQKGPEFSEFASEGAQGPSIESSAHSVQSPIDAQSTELASQHHLDDTNVSAGGEALAESSPHDHYNSEFYEEGEMVEPKLEIPQESPEQDHSGVVSVVESPFEEVPKPLQVEEKPSEDKCMEQPNVNADNGLENYATDSFYEHISPTHDQSEQQAYEGFTNVYPSEESHLQQEQYENISYENNAEFADNQEALGSNTYQGAWEEVPGYGEYNNTEGYYAQEYTPSDAPVEGENQTQPHAMEEPLSSDVANTQQAWEGGEGYYSGEQHGYNEEYYPQDYQQHGYEHTVTSNVESTEQNSHEQQNVDEIPDEGVVPTDNNTWQTEGAVYGNGYENYGYYDGQQYESNYYGQGQGEAVEGHAGVNPETLEQYTPDNQGAVVPDQESYYNEQGYYQEDGQYQPNQDYYQQEYAQYDPNSGQPSNDAQHTSEQYSVQDEYGGASQYYQPGHEQEASQMYYDQQSHQPYGIDQSTNNRSVGDAQAIANYSSDQNFGNQYDRNMGQGDSYYGEKSAVDSGIYDPLGRTKGSPIVTFGFGGKVLFMFPQVVTRFSASSSTPVTKVYPGELKFHSLGNIVGEKKANSFPGPLLFDSEKSSIKARKKAVGEFLDTKIRELSESPSIQTEEDSQNEIILWKLLKVLCDHDGVLLGSADVEKETLEVVFPQSMHKRNSDVSRNPPQHKQASPGALDSLQELLLKGDRSVATKFAMDNGLWAHALIIGSCVGKETWQQVVQKFTQEEISSDKDSNRESMTVMYNLFAGLGKDAIKDFAPLSATDPQPHFFTPESLPKPLVSPLSSQPLQNAVSVDKLSKWRETVAMILANRTPGDTQALTSFGDLLRSQGWIYAAHICYLLSPQSSIHSGLDTPSVKTVLFGVDHGKYLACFARDLNALDRTEIYEHAISLRSSTPVNGLPFLQPYKLHRAWYLADCGYTNEALRYCESIANIVKVHPKGSPYFHELFLEKLKELHERLTKSLGDKASSSNVTTLSWLTTMKKPTLGSLMDAVDRGLNRFIVGESENPKPKSEVTHEITADPFSTYNPRVSVLQAPNMEVPVRSASVNDITSRYEHLRKHSPFSHNGDVINPHGRRSASPSSPSSGINQYEGVPVAMSRSYTTSFAPTNVRGEVESKINEDSESTYEPPKGNHVPSLQNQPPLQSESSWENPAYGYGYGYGYGYDQNSEYNTQNQQQNEATYTEESTPSTNQYGWSQPPANEYDSSYGYQGATTTNVNDYDSAQSNSNQEGQFVSLMSNSASLVPTFGSAVGQSYPVQQTPSTPAYNDDDEDDLGFGNKSLSRKKPTEAPKAEENAQDNQGEGQTAEAKQEKPEDKEQEANGGSWSLFSFLGRKKDSKPAPAKAHLPSGSNFYFDEVQKKWVNKAATAEESKPAALPPPPTGLNRAQSASPTVGTLAGGPPSVRSSPGPSLLGPPGAGIGMTRSHSSTSGTTRRGVRNRYVDVMNPN